MQRHDLLIFTASFSSMLLQTTVLVIALCGLVTSQSSPIVDLGYAKYQGTFDATNNQTNFLSIRYAAPPVGNLRFQAPQAPLNESALGVQMANVQPAGCPMAGMGTMITTPFRNQTSTRKRQAANPSEPEDCLFLNVFVSGTLDSSASMPVIVWIHGGGYVAGSENGSSGDNLINEAGGGLVVVNMEYRLGVFGFLPGSQVKERGSLNNGLLDQQAVLQWTQDFIHLFGGDPNRVTIWGESAGAGSVLQHMVAHLGNTEPPLFQQAITSSTFLPSQYNFDAPIAEQLYNEFVQQTGCAGANDTFACLVAVPEGELEGANVAINEDGFFGVFVLVPVVDGEFIVESPTKTIMSGQLNGDAYLGITNQFEGTIFVNSTFTSEMTLEDYVTQLAPQFSAQQISQAVAIYSDVTGLDTVTDQAIAVMGESIFICPTYTILQNFNGLAFKGEFAIPPGTHGSDVAYYFPNGNPPPFANAAFDASFAGAFTGFAKFNGDPNNHPVPNIITPQWNLFNDSNTEMLFNRTESFQPDVRAITTDPALLERCTFWQSVAETFPQ